MDFGDHYGLEIGMKQLVRRLNLTLVTCVPKLRVEHVSFLFLTCFSMVKKLY